MKKTIILILLGFFTVISGYTQTQNYVVKDIIYDIKGSTKPFFLEQRVEYGIGDEFTTLEEVEEYRLLLMQEFENLRVFEEQDVTTTIEENNIILHITLDDAWGLIPFGYPKYDSEDGWRVATRLFWYNTLGTLTNSQFQAGMYIDENSITEDWELTTWDLKFSVDDILIMDRFYNISFKQSTERDSKDDEEWSYSQTKLSIGTSFDIFNDYSYSPTISLISKYNYDVVEESMLEDDLESPTLSLSYSHGISESNVNWMGNFRNGYSYGISNSLSLDFEDEEVNPSTTISIFGTYFKSIPNFPIAFGTKLTAVGSNDEMTGLGSYVRGVDSGDLYGTLGLFSNINLFISVIKIEHFAEAIFGPHFDIGITDDSELKYGAGGDFILYVNKLKSLVARGSISADLTEFDPSDFSMDDFAISITSSLFF